MCQDRVYLSFEFHPIHPFGLSLDMAGSSDNAAATASTIKDYKFVE